MPVSVRLLVAAGLLLFAAGTTEADPARDTWRVTFETRWLGPVEANIEIMHDAERLRGRSLSGAVDLLRELPGDQELDDGLMAFEALATDTGEYDGSFAAPWHEGRLHLTIDGDTLQGTVEGGAFAGKLTGVRTATPARIRDYPEILDALDRVVAAKLFAPDDLEEPAYRKFRHTLGRIAAAANDDLDLLLGFRWAWSNDPFSHFELKRSQRNAEALFAFFDDYRVGFEAATVEFEGRAAILKVRTMMGADTIEQIEAAYDRIADQNPRSLIIDLRGNGGGAFAVKPLVEHVIDEPLDAGYFLSQVWNREHDSAPTTAEVLEAAPWAGWSIVSFWKSVQERGILRIRFEPAEPNFDGPVYVLIDSESASATELAADALRSSGKAVLIGERSAGQMLSQSMFDVADGFIVSLPVADYRSMTHGRIEGHGVDVDVPAASEDALDVAKRLAEVAASSADVDTVSPGL
jgi:carboxyl-terminal processing protease